MPPKGSVSIAKNSAAGTGGVIPINPANLQTTPAKATIRLKLEVRRLPPSLTQDEFLSAFGEEWKVGAGKVSWLEYRGGKVKSPGKHPEQSRAYLHLTNESHIKPFEAKFLSITFQDAKGTHKDPNLRHLPPTLGFAPSQRVPAAKQRMDGRQGTIDQDPEFIAFLEGETQPVAKPASLDNSVSEKTKEKITSTPLIDALREKKANKAKTVAAKSIKHDAKDEKGSTKATSGKGGKAAQADVPAKGGNKTDQSARDATKGSNKETAKTAASNVAAASSSPGSTGQASNRKRDRVTPSSIKSMLQRDLGLNTPPKRGAKQPVATDTAAALGQTASAATPATTATAAAAGKTTKSPRPARANTLAEKGNGQLAPQENPKLQATSPAGILKKSPGIQAPPRGPRGKPNTISTALPPASNAAASTPPPASASVTQRPARPVPQPALGATKAYLKHANASQGITEPLIVAALSTFGDVVSVEIDKRKGTALAEFKNHDSLKAALSKRSVAVAQGAVEVLEYREKQAPPAARGGGAAGRGGSMRGRGRGGSARGGASTQSGAAANAGATSTATPPVTTACPATGDGT